MNDLTFAIKVKRIKGLRAQADFISTKAIRSFSKIEKERESQREKP